MFKKSWDDQPDEVVVAGVILRMTPSKSSHAIEVRHGKGKYYVTNGNLFGSQTLVTEDPLLAFSVLQMIVRHKDGEQMKVPDGVELVQ